MKLQAGLTEEFRKRLADVFCKGTLMKSYLLEIEDDSTGRITGEVAGKKFESKSKASISQLRRILKILHACKIPAYVAPRMLFSEKLISYAAQNSDIHCSKRVESTDDLKYYQMRILFDVVIVSVEFVRGDEKLDIEYSSNESLIKFFRELYGWKLSETVATFASNTLTYNTRKKWR